MDGLRVLGRTYRHLNRYREVAGILARHGFGDALHALRLDHYVDLSLKAVLRRPKVVEEISRPERVRLAAQELGPTFIKAGQYLSTRPDVVAPEYLAELRKLQDSVPPFPFSEAKEIVETDLGKPLKVLFKEFDHRPLAAASIAQVHAARLPDGRGVVVKIQRPGLKQTVRVDLEIMAHLADLAEKHSDLLSGHRPTRLAAEIARSLAREMDFSLEASHIERFARQFAHNPSARVPRVHRSLCSPRVLTLEMLHGVRPDDLGRLKRAKIDPKEVARTLAAQYLEMIFVHGFFHADPHPGNLLIGPGPVVGYVDFGMMGRLDRELKEGLADVLAATAGRDQAALSRALLALADYDQPPESRLFEDDLAEIMDQYAYRPLREWRFGRALEQLFELSARHRVRVPAELFLMLKAITELENLACLLDPDFDALTAAEPFVRWVHEERLRPRRLAERLADAGRDALNLLGSAPADLRELFRQLRAGKLLIEFEHKGLEPLLTTLDKVSNRLAFAVLLGALVIGSALLTHSGMPPYFHGVSALGVAGFAVSGLMALWLIAAILRHGRL